MNYLFIFRTKKNVKFFHHAKDPLYNTATSFSLFSLSEALDNIKRRIKKKIYKRL